MLAVWLSSQAGICLCLPLVLCTAQMFANAPRIAFPPLPVPAGAVAEGRLLLIVANKLDALAPAQREQALGLIRGVVEESLPDVR